MPDSTNIIAYQTADLAAGTISPEQITCTQYDRQAKLIAVRLKENGKDWTIPTGYRANVRMRKADGVYVYNTCTTEGNIAYITLTEQMCGVVGEQIYVLEVINGDHAVQSVTGRLKVIQNPIDDEDADFTSAPEYTTIQTAVADAQQAAQDAVDAAQEVVDENLAGYLKKSGGDMTGDVNMAYGTGIKAKPDISHGSTSLLDIGNNTGYSTTIRFLTARSSPENNRVAFAIRDNMQGGGVRTKLDCYGNIITNLADPTSETDAANKRYVDKLKESCAAAYAPISAAIRPTVSGNPVLVQDSVAWPLQSLVLHGKTTQDGTPSPDNPVPLVSAGDDGEIDVTVCGGNLLHLTDKSGTLGGVQYAVSNGTITLNGTSSNNNGIFIVGHSYTGDTIALHLPAGIYKLSGMAEGTMLYGYKTGSEVQEVRFSDIETTLNEDTDFVSISVRWHNDTQFDNVTLAPILNVGSTALPWKPYTGNTITISTPNGLPGIPVDSGGNYTDSTGQQWICDEIDLVNGKIKRNIKKAEINGNNNFAIHSSNVGKNPRINLGIYDCAPAKSAGEKGPIMAERYSVLTANQTYNNSGIGISVEIQGIISIYDPNITTVEAAKEFFGNHPMEIIYQTASPKEEDLGEIEIELESQNGTTTAYTAADTDLTMQYVADAQKYIDNKIGAVSAAMLEE